MAIINRLSRLFRADFHAVLDRIEEPEQMLRQAVREMDNEVAQMQRYIEQQQRTQAALETRKRELGARVETADRELDLCFANDKPELARALVRQKLEADRLITHVDGKLATLADDIARNKARLDEQRATLESIRQKADVFAGESVTDEPAVDVVGATRDFSITDADVDIAMLREQQLRGAS